MTNGTPDHAARDVADALLQSTAKALLAADYDAFATHFHLPLTMSTRSSRIMVTRPDEMRRIFEASCQFYARSGLTSLRRYCEVAEFRGADRIESTFITEFPDDTRQVASGYPAFTVIERFDGQWKITSTEYDLPDDSGLAVALRASGSAEEKAMAIYQDHLDATSTALLTQDFAAFEARINLPHVITTEAATVSLRTREEMRRAFEDFSTLYRDAGMTDFVRIADDARFMTRDEILGVHTSHQMRDGKRLVPPYPNRVRLVRGEDGNWRETHCANAVLNDSDNFGKWAKVSDHPRLPDLNTDA